VSAKIYIEGGGDGHLLDTLFRRAWTAFFRAAGLSGKMPAVVRGKGRRGAFDDFVTALSGSRPGQVPLLLVDSEDAVQPGHGVWQHLQARDKWERPAGASDDQAFLMVRLMETWLLADRDLLRRYFGPTLREASLRAWPALEDVPKATVLEALDRATAGCPKRYEKGKTSFELVEDLNPQLVQEACPHARALLDRLRAL
jgi:hypothetical protein